MEANVLLLGQQECEGAARAWRTGVGVSFMPCPGRRGEGICTKCPW